jgi:hypothetical protein
MGSLIAFVGQFVFALILIALGVALWNRSKSYSDRNPLAALLVRLFVLFFLILGPLAGLLGSLLR